MGEPVEIGCLQIRTGDLLHADCHGVQKIPLEIAAEIPGAVERVAARERELIALCNDPAFSIEKLKELLNHRGEHAGHSTPPAG
jgi:regulator of RNase E activity RraA